MDWNLMKLPNQSYVNLSKISLYPITSGQAKSIIIKNHYLHTAGACKYAYGIYFDSFLIGCLTYGYPVGRQVLTSIFTNITLEHDKVLELTRLWIADGYGTNIESWAIGQSFKWLRKNYIDILISYADPLAGHVGSIYQATNWIYQGNNTMLIKGYWFYINGQKMHPRSVVAKYGSIKDNILIKIDDKYKRVPMEKKHRYIYILNKKMRKTGKLKHNVKDYPK